MSGREARRWCRGRAYELKSVSSESWLKAEKRWGSALESLPVSRPVRRWLRQFLSSDSAWEVLVLYLLAALEAQPILANPHTDLDFRGQPIVDAFGKAWDAVCCRVLRKGACSGRRFASGPRWAPFASMR